MAFAVGQIFPREESSDDEEEDEEAKGSSQ
jgi:hypothetical protein